MKVRKSTPRVSAILIRLLLAIPLSMAITTAVHTAPAGAITRDEVLARANTWVKKRVRYSQSGYYRGYRRDCSGMVSMAWGLKTSYTSNTIGSRAKRVSKKNLKPGDAVHTPGHVSIFVGWANKKRTRYRVMEQSGQGKPALKRTRTWRRNARGLRLRGIEENPVLVAAAPVDPGTTPGAPAASAPVAASAPATAPPTPSPIPVPATNPSH